MSYSDAETRYNYLRKSLKRYREFSGMSLKDVSDRCDLKEHELESIELGTDKDMVNFLIYAQTMGLSLNLQV